MRVLDILENFSPLDAGQIGTQNVRPISRTDHMPNQVIAIKQNLKRHTLVTNRTQQGPQLGGKAWSGTESGEWTQALDNALLAWKKSINLQTPPYRIDSPLSTTTPPTLRAIDIDFLQKRELTRNGLLKSDESRRTIQTKGIFDGFTYEQKIPGKVEDAIDTNTMLEAVGPSAWWRIATEIEESKRSSPGDSWLDKTSKEEVSRIVQELALYIYTRDRDMTYSDEAWQTTFDRKARQTTAVYADGTEEQIASGSITIRPDQQFTKYSNMAIKLWEKDNIKLQARQDEVDRAENTATTSSTLDDTTLRAMATALNKAFENSMVAALPGGRSFFNDIEAIAAQLRNLNTAKDFDDLATIYQQMFNEELHERIHSELSKEDYASIFVSRMIGIQRIAPSFLHASINFAQNTEVETNYEGNTYTISKEDKVGLQSELDHHVTNYNDYNVIVVDGIYRKAIETSGGVMPDFDVAAEPEQIRDAQVLFINVINTSYPEMVAFYVRAEPFDAASVDLGGARLKNIINDAAKLMTSPDDARRYITEQIADDRGWLTGEDGGEPGANIYFDEKYLAEGLNDRNFPVLSADDKAELDGAETQLSDQILSSDEATVRAAVDELLQLPDGEEKWKNIYRDAAPGTWLDLLPTMGDGKNDVKEFIENATNSNSPILRVATTYDLAVAAPRAMAELFKDAMKFAISTGGTDEDLITALVAQIKDREDYELIDERYKQLPGVNDSLIDDLASEQLFGMFGYGWDGQLASIIGEPERLEAIRVELDSETIDALQDLENDPSIEHIEAMKRRTSNNAIKSNEDQLELIVDRLEATLGGFANTGSAEYVMLMDYYRELKEALDEL